MSETSRINVVIAGGGTGGHFFPGVATAQAILEVAPDAAITFVGTGRPVEKKVLEALPYSYVVLATPRLERSLHPANAVLPVRFAGAVVKAGALLKKLAADVVIGTGGYGSAPVILAAWLRRVPRVILEQNIIPGLTNRLLARVSDLACLAFEPASSFINKRVRVAVTGNPIRAVGDADDAVGARRRLGLNETRRTVFVYGGSQGARRLVEAVAASWTLLADVDVQLIVQTGAETGLEIPPPWRGRVIVRRFFEDIYDCYRAADVVVGRAGGGVAEALAFGKPLVLVPYPYAAHDHQMRNAVYLEQEGAAVVVDDGDFSGEVFADLTRTLFADDERRDGMARASRELGRADAALRVARASLALVRFKQ